MKTVSIRVAVPVELQREFKAATAANGETMTRVLLIAIREYVGRRRKEERAQRPWKEAQG